jgi:hypothetical protein
MQACHAGGQTRPGKSPNQAADEITRFAKKYIGRALSGGGPDPETSAEGEVEIDAAAAPEVIKEDEAQAEELQEKFGVQLSSALSRELTGADASLVRAYEAVLWRLAVLASWERRSIAIAGAPQGSEWMTICRPHEVGRVIAPSRIWKEVGGESALRRPLHHVPVEFFVKPLAAGGRLDQEVNKVNTAFGRKGVDLDQPVSSDDEAWHRIDGLRAGWIALQPDSETEERLQREYKASPGGMLGGKRHFNTTPLEYAEYPECWGALLDIDGTHGLAVLIDGVDKFAADSKAAGDAVESLLEG